MTLSLSPYRSLFCPALVLCALLASSCPLLQAQTADQELDAAKPSRDFQNPKDRLEAMKHAALFAPTHTAEADIARGPDQSKKLFALGYDDKVICDFTTAGKEMGGKTPKFGCLITRVESADGTVQSLTPEMKETTVKVKFGPNDNEVYAELPATRLMWAMGYYVDTWYPVRVECHNCPANPVKGTGAVATRTFNPATIVRKFSWEKMTEAGKPDEGWSWKELDTVNERPTYERDGLKLLAVFLQHSDNKPPQQRLDCHKVDVDDKTQPATVTCDKSVMLVQDVGATFGGGGLFTFNGSAKMNLDEWSGKKLWISVGTDASPRQCRGRLQKSIAARDGLENPAISEEGRRLDAGLMCQLSDQQIRQLFVLSRAAAMPKYHNRDGSFKAGENEDKITEEWVTAFKTRREELASGRCEWKQKPADLSVIENPLGLAEVPNFCTAKPY